MALLSGATDLFPLALGLVILQRDLSSIEVVLKRGSYALSSLLFILFVYGALSAPVQASPMGVNVSPDTACTLGGVEVVWDCPASIALKLGTIAPIKVMRQATGRGTSVSPCADLIMWQQEEIGYGTQTHNAGFIGIYDPGCR